MDLRGKVEELVPLLRRIAGVVTAYVEETPAPPRLVLVLRRSMDYGDVEYAVELAARLFRGAGIEVKPKRIKASKKGIMVELKLYLSSDKPSTMVM